MKGHRGGAVRDRVGDTDRVTCAEQGGMRDVLVAISLLVGLLRATAGLEQRLP